MTKPEINKKDENDEIKKWKIRYDELAEANRHILQRESKEIKKLQSEVLRLAEAIKPFSELRSDSVWVSGDGISYIMPTVFLNDITKAKTILKALDAAQGEKEKL